MSLPHFFILIKYYNDIYSWIRYFKPVLNIFAKTVYHLPHSLLRTFQNCSYCLAHIHPEQTIHLFFQIKSFFRKNCGLVSNLCMADTVNPKSVNVKKVICLTGQPFGQLAFLNHIRYSYFEEHPMSLQIYSLNNHLLRSNFN